MNPKFTYGVCTFTIEKTPEERIEDLMAELKKVDADLESLSNMHISTATLKAARIELIARRKEIKTSLHKLVEEL